VIAKACLQLREHIGLAMFHPNGPTFFELAQQALSSTERGYDLLAPKFDYTPFRTPDWLLEIVGSYLDQSGPFASGLDLCCGTGAGLEMLRPACRERVVGIDFSEGMLSVCREKLAASPGQAVVEPVRGNILALPFDAAFDIVVCFGSFGHVLPCDEPRFVAEIARVLRPGGRFVFATSYPPPWWSRRWVLSRLFNAAMHVRNALWSPPFIMYYLTFLLPEVESLLQRQGLDVEIRDPGIGKPWADVRLVSATRQGGRAS
jgi:ubiquinone/menaquinone biosynthesis C-methylase UbiE